jgi:hypothetical protein
MQTAKQPKSTIFDIILKIKAGIYRRQLKRAKRKAARLSKRKGIEYIVFPGLKPKVITKTLYRKIYLSGNVSVSARKMNKFCKTI